MAAPLPLAAGLDWIEAILPFLFLLFWIISQVRNLFRGLGKPAEKVVVRPRPKPPAAEDAHHDIQRQIEEFLRRSGVERPVAPEAGRGDAPRSRGAVKQPQRSGGPPPVPGEHRPARPAREPARPRPAAEPARPLGSLGGHATDVARHVADAFAHDLEHRPAGLARQSPATAAATPQAPATDLVALLRNPATLRQLVIVREVLDRPIERW